MSYNRERRFDGEKASSLFSVIAYSNEDKVFLNDDNTLGFGFLCNPLEGSDHKASDRINVLLNGNWPDDTLMQFSLFGGQDIHSITNRMMDSRRGKSNDFGSHNAKRRKEFFIEGTHTPVVSSTGVRIRNFMLLVSIKVPINNPTPTQKELMQVRDLRNGFNQSLKAVGMHPNTLGRDEYVHLMNSMLNWGEGALWRNSERVWSDADKPLNEQIMDFDHCIEVDKDGLWLGESGHEDAMRVTNLSVKRFPRVFDFGYASSFLGDLMLGSRGIRENCLISATIHFPPVQKTKGSLETKRQWAVNQAYGPMLKFVPALAAKKHGFDVLFQALDDGDRPVRLHLGMTLFTRTKDEATAAVSSARSYWGELGFGMMEDRFFNLPLFLNRLPFGADRDAMRDTFRYKTMGTRHAIPLLPLFADWRGTGSPVMNFVSRNGQLMSVSLFDSSSNYNCCIAAQSGSGKSFLANEMISTYREMGGKVWVIDVGRSYKDLCEVYDGDFIEFNKESDICLNPFPLIQDFAEEEDMIVGLVCAMAAPTTPLTDYQTASLKRIMREVWDKKAQDMTVTDIAALLLESDDRRVRDIGVQLYPFTKDGEYGKYFYGENNVNFQRDFSVLELEELKGREHLQQVVLLQLIYQIQQDMYLGDRDRHKIVIIDEAWSLLTEGDVGKFIEHGYRRFRKYGGAAVVITQSVTDLYDSPTGRAIAENSANMFLLGQKSEAISALEKEQRLPIGSSGYSLLKTVHTEVGAYSEIFFITGYGGGIGRLIVDKYHQLLYSTHPNDVQAIQRKRQGGMTMPEAIEAILKERGQD